jgi:hypothetical protein
VRHWPAFLLDFVERCVPCVPHGGIHVGGCTAMPYRTCTVTAAETSHDDWGRTTIPILTDVKLTSGSTRTTQRGNFVSQKELLTGRHRSHLDRAQDASSLTNLPFHWLCRSASVSRQSIN